MRRGRRKEIKRFSRRNGKMFREIDDKIVKKMIDANRQLFEKLTKKFGSLELVRVKSCLPQAVKKPNKKLVKLVSNRPMFHSIDGYNQKQRLAESGIHVLYIQDKFYIKLSCNEGNDLGFSDSLFWSPDDQFWTNDTRFKKEKV